MIRRSLFLLTLFILLPLTLRAQTDSVVQAPRSVNEGTMVSLGSRYVKNTYLSDVGYDGVGIGVINERMRIINDRWSRQRTFRIDLASIRNPAGTSSGYAAFIGYSYSLHRRLETSVDGLRLLVGGTGPLAGQPATGGCLLLPALRAIVLRDLYPWPSCRHSPIRVAAQ